mgnify:CR=1 FL=1
MKTITLILSVLVSLSLYPQEPYKLYSKVWFMVNVNKSLDLRPIDKSNVFKLLRSVFRRC